MGVDDIRILCIILAIITIYLLLRYRNLRRELTSVSKQLEALVSDETEKMIDITFVDKELERLAGLLNEYNEKQRMVVAGAMQNEEYLKDSVANISHDLRTPLTVILGHLQLLDTQALPPEQAERIAIVRNKAERMKELVETFYEYSLLHTSGMELKTERINVTNLMINLITENAPAMEEKNLEPEVSLPEHSVYLETDREALERILQNLMTNAIRYSAGNIGVRLTEENDTVCFTVSNPVPQGSIAEPERLFERFYTGDRSRHDGSTGLGLAVVKELTEKIGGEVKAECRDDRLCMTVRIERSKAIKI